MSERTFIEKLQTVFGVTKTELLFVGVILGGLLIGAFAQKLTYREEQSAEESEISAMIFKSLDSLAETERSTFTGTDIKDNPIPELAAGDTLVEKEKYIPNPNRQSGGKSPAGMVDLNTASKVQLMQLPGIGEKTALKIMEYRAGRKFASAADIMNIKGIGPKKFEKMKQYIEIK